MFCGAFSVGVPPRGTRRIIECPRPRQLFSLSVQEKSPGAFLSQLPTLFDIHSPFHDYGVLYQSFFHQLC